METGILYVVYNKWISNPDTNDMPYKIGITKGSVYDRYYGLGLKMPGKFETLFAYELEDYTKAEQYIMGILRKYRENGEWFNISQKEINLIKANCEAMGGVLVTNEVRNEIEIETEEDTIISSIPQLGQNALNYGQPINPNRPCKVFIFHIGNAIAERETVYNSTRCWWRITEQYRDFSDFEFAVGLKDRISLGSYKIKKWVFNADYGKCAFEGEEIPDLKGFTWVKQTNVGYWNRGNHLVVEFDGNGKFRRLRPKEDQWIDCI